MIARRRCVSELDPKNPQQGYVSVGPATGRGKKRPPGRDTGRPLARLPAPDLLRFHRHNLMLIRSDPTRNVVWTTHVGPNPTLAQRHGRIIRKRTSWQPPPKPRLLFNCVGGRLLEPILTQTAHFLVPVQRLKSLNHHPQWRLGNFGRKLPCGKTLRSHDAEIEVGPEPPRGGAVPWGSPPRKALASPFPSD